MRFATVWKDCEQQLFQNTTKEVLWVLTVLLSHQIDSVESIDSPNYGQQEFLGPDLLLHLLRDTISRYAPFRRVMKFQGESTLVPRHKSLKFIYFSREPREWVITLGKFPSESVANWSLTRAGSNVNEIFSYRAIPANDSRESSGGHTGLQ
jgi:hypothetical protein